MKNLLLSLLTLIAFSAAAQTTTVEKVIVNYFDAFASLDIGKANGYATSDMVILENGMIWNSDTIAQKMSARKSDSTFKRINKFDFINTKIDGSTAWTYYYNQASGTSNGKPFTVRWLESAVLVKEKGDWKIKLLHSTPLEKPVKKPRIN